MSYEGKKVLVTGGAGFVGSALSDALVKDGARVTVLDDLFTGSTENLDLFNEMEFVEGSVIDAELVSRLVSDADIVFHLAVRNIIVSTRAPLMDFTVNVGGVFNVLMAAAKHKTQRVVYTSSASVYGNPRYYPSNEDDGINILTPYAASKLSGEHYCEAFAENYGVSSTVVRYTNVYGPKQSPKNPYCGVVSKFFDAMEKDESLKIFGDGLQTRDFTFIDDAIRGTMLVGLAPRAEGEIFNIGTGRETAIVDLAKEIMEVVGRPTELEFVEKRDIDTVRRRVLNVEKARKKLGWGPLTTLRSGLEKTHEWMMKRCGYFRRERVGVDNFEQVLEREMYDDPRFGEWLYDKVKQLGV